MIFSWLLKPQWTFIFCPLIRSTTSANRNQPSKKVYRYYGKMLCERVTSSQPASEKIMIDNNTGDILYAASFRCHTIPKKKDSTICTIVIFCETLPGEGLMMFSWTVRKEARRWRTKAPFIVCMYYHRFWEVCSLNDIGQMIIVFEYIEPVSEYLIFPLKLLIY